MNFAGGRRKHLDRAQALHEVDPLARQPVALAVLPDRQQGLERLPLLRAHGLQQQVFAQLLLAFELASADPRVVGVNMVQPEDWLVPMRMVSKPLPLPAGRSTKWL